MDGIKKQKRASDVILDIAHENPQSQQFTYHHILKILGERAFGISLIFFALPSAMPVSAIPGISFLFTIPIGIFALQILFLRKSLWLPPFLGRHTVSQKTIHKIASKAAPYLRKIEKMIAGNKINNAKSHQQKNKH